MIDVDISDLEQALKDQLEKLNEDEIKKANTRIGAKLLALSKRSFSQQKTPFGVPWKPSRASLTRGGQTLRDSGRLQNSIFVKTNSGGVRLFVQNLDYADVYNSGFKGEVSVRRHIRVIRKAFGKPITPVRATVREHFRNMNIVQRQFIPNEGKIPEKWADIVVDEYSKIWSGK